jgi:hypothetical protein
MPYPADPSAADSPAVVLLRREQAEALMRASEANGGHRWSDGAVEAAWELTHGHPYLLQHLCWHVGERTRAKAEASEKARPPLETSRTKRCATCGHTSPVDRPHCATCGAETWQHVARSGPTATQEDVEAAVPATLDASRSTLARLWEGLPPPMRAVAWLLAKAGPEAMPEARLRRLFAGRGMLEAARDPAKAPRSTEGWDLLEAVDGGYRLQVDLLRRWIAALDPPEGALDLAEATLDTADKQEAAARPDAEARGEDPPRAATKPLGEDARAPHAVVAPVGIGGAGGASAAAKKRARRSIAPWVGAAVLAGIAALLGWVARGGLGATSTAPPGAAAPSASVTGSAEAPAADDDGSNLPPGRGYLIVDSPTPSGVFAFGTFIGLTGRKLEVSCGPRFLRLGVPPTDGTTQPMRIVWTGPGKSALVACKAVTRVSLTSTK